MLALLQTGRALLPGGVTKPEPRPLPRPHMWRRPSVGRAGLRPQSRQSGRCRGAAVRPGPERAGEDAG